MSQQTLFDIPSEVELAGDVRAREVPEHLYIGTSSWTFPGWKDVVYRGAHDEKVLARAGLAAYATHPAFTGIGLDRTHYAPITDEDYARYREQTPAGFKFLVKAHDALSLYRFPKHKRYGKKGGQRNLEFLDAAYATDVVIGPTVEGLGDRLGVLLFQFAPQDLSEVDFPRRLFDFLSQLPLLPLGAGYAVEVRNPSLLSDDYRDALITARVSHCLNAIHGMPSVREQVMRLGRAIAPPRDDEHPSWVVARWMLRRGFTYGEAFERYHPFNRVIDRDEETRAELSRIITHGLSSNKRVLMTVNNKAEGCAPRSIEMLLDSLS